MTEQPKKTIALPVIETNISDQMIFAEEELSIDDIKVVRNVSRPTLSAFIPDPSVANGSAIIVCPGGAFHFLSIEMEGTEVAQWLCARGIAAFVLKYRTIQTGDDFPEIVWKHLDDEKSMTPLMGPLLPKILSDGQQAVRVIRERADEWNIDRNRIGMIGFSAGSTVTENVALKHDPICRPDFAAAIYSAGNSSEPVPNNAPPLFILCASDDDMAVPNSIDLYQSWRESGKSTELHIIAKGGHGFGMRELGQPTDTWIELFYAWLKGLSLLGS